MARKCGVCGEAGHNARNCPTTEDDKAYAERQKTLVEPKMIHVCQSGIEGYVCGSPNQEWPARCMDDSFAKKLPMCPDCLAHVQAKNPDFTW